MTFTLHTDGGARGNPGPGGIGIVLKNSDQEVVYEAAKYIGECTNNEAEYLALIEGLKASLGKDVKQLESFVDSELVVKQLNGEYKVKNERLKSLHAEASQFANSFEKITFTHVRREKNKRADELVNEALDSHGH